jgi:DNA-binding NarL/FixJ family response regulator
LDCTGFGNLFRSRFDEAIHNKGFSIALILCANSHIGKSVRKATVGEAWLNSELMTKAINDLRQARASAPMETPGEEDVKTAAAPALGWRLPNSKRDEYEEVKIARLTDREREVIELVGKGMRNQQIADKLCISVITV